MNVAIPYVDSKGVRHDQWSARTLAVTADYLIVIDPQGGRVTLGLADVVTTGTNYGLLTIVLSNGAEFRFAMAPEALEHVERDLRQLIAWHRQSRGGVGRVSMAEELGKLAELRNQGVLDSGDWERAKDLFLGKSEDARARAARDLRQIYELNKSGVLSDSEFNMKKWDILARTN